jgi:hypothetical protein
MTPVHGQRLYVPFLEAISSVRKVIGSLGPHITNFFGLAVLFRIYCGPLECTCCHENTPRLARTGPCIVRSRVGSAVWRERAVRWIMPRQGLWIVWTAVLLAAFLCLPWSVHAITIRFEATDLLQPGPGGSDLWQYTYHVSNVTPQANTAFEILFDPALYSHVQDPPPAVPDWDIVALQPDPSLPDPGRYSALALRDGAALTGPFTVTFTWLAPRPVFG